MSDKGDCSNKRVFDLLEKHLDTRQGCALAAALGLHGQKSSKIQEGGIFAALTIKDLGYLNMLKSNQGRREALVTAIKKSNVLCPFVSEIITELLPLDPPADDVAPSPPPTGDVPRAWKRNLVADVKSVIEHCATPSDGLIIADQLRICGVELDECGRGGVNTKRVLERLRAFEAGTQYYWTRSDHLIGFLKVWGVYQEDYIS